MRPMRHGSLLRPVGKVARTAVPVATATAVLFSTPGVVPGLAVADPSPDTLAALIADVATANQRLQDLGAEIQAEKEGVNKAVVDLQDARDKAESAQHDVDASKQAVEDADAAITAAQQRFNKFAVATYVNGPSVSYLTAANPDQLIATATAGETLATSSQRAMANLQQARTAQVNKESQARRAKQDADAAVSDAQSSQNAAVAKLTEAEQTFDQQREQIERVAAERDGAQVKLAAARTGGGAAPSPADGAAPSDQWDGADRRSGAKTPGNWDGPLPGVPEGLDGGDPVGVLNTLLGYSSNSLQATQDMGRKFMQRLGLIPTPSGEVSPGTDQGGIPRVYGRQASEYVIRRAMAQRGVPYSWGGGTAQGPSKGIGSGSGIVGFDCSGLILFAFAGVGIKLPHYTGDQYKLGRQIPSSQARRGDVVFYGPNASQHVALYLGQNQMLEAPDEGDVVKISPLRTSGMTPFAVRYIEY